MKPALLGRTASGRVSGDEAEDTLRKAEKKSVVSLTQWKPDYEGACELFERAGTLFKNSNRKAQAFTAYEKLSMCKEKLGEFYLAARHLETAGHCARESSSASGEEVGALFRRAAALYVQAARPQAAAEALSHGGKAVEALDAGLAVELYLEACASFEEEGKDVYAMDTYRAAVACTVRTERYADAVAVLLRFAGACDRAGSHASLARCYLSAVVLFLAQGDPVGAQLGFDDYSAVPGFGRTDESRAAWELLDAYQQADPAAIRKAVGRGVFTGLEQCVIKLAKRLPVGDLKAQAAKLNATRGGGPSEDAAALQDDDLT